MSQNGAMTGFTWPSPVSGSPSPNITTSASSVLTTGSAMISSGSIPMTSTASDGGTFFYSNVATNVAASQRTTHIEITQTVTATPTAMVESATCTCSDAPSETCTHTNSASQPTAADADIDRGEPFQMTAPLVASIPTEPAVSETAAAATPGDSSSPTNYIAIIGGLIGAFCGGILLALLVAYLKRSKSRRKDEEKDQNTDITEEQHHHVQPDAQNEPPRVFQTYEVDPVALANARNWQQGPGILVSDSCGNRDQIHHTSSDPSFGISLADLAQAQGWNLSFGADNLQPRRDNMGPQDPTQAVTQNPAKTSRPLDQMSPMSYHTRDANRDRSGSPFTVGDPRYDQTRYANRSRSVSPFAVDDMHYDHSGPRDYDDVSLCDSPILPRRQSR